MNNANLIYAIMAVALLFQAGCASENRIEIIKQICEPNIEKQQAMEIAEEILAGMYFTIEKSDRQQGLIRTKALPGAQSFEFWRSDNVGRFNEAEANLHSIQRVVELNVFEQNGQICINCNVQVWRLSLPDCDITHSARAYNLLSESGSAFQRLRITGKQKEQTAWINIANDPELQTAILQKIQKQIANK